MSKAIQNRYSKLEECKDKLSFQNQVVRNRVTNAENSDSQKEYETLNRYCDRQVKSRKLIKRKTDDRVEQVTWKRQKDQEKGNLRKMRVKEQHAHDMAKLQQSVEEYQERWYQTGFSSHNAPDFDSMTDSEIGKRVKRNLRVQD